MNRVQIVNLAGQAWHVEDGGVAALDAWLDQARERLASDPDRDELVADFERAIADRCAAAAPGDRDVVTTAQVESILTALGPVEPVADEQPTSQVPAPAADVPFRERRLYRLTGDDAMLAGVCSGLAAYLNLDATVVRVLVVLLTVMTSGALVIVYIAMALLVPEANSPERRAAVLGSGLTAEEMLARARAQASPALATLGSLITSAGTLLVRALRWLLLVAIMLLLAAWAVAVGWLAIDTSVVLDAFDPGTSAWIGALWITCIAWVPIAILLACERVVAAVVEPRARTTRRGTFALSTALVTSTAAAVIGTFAIPASHSEQLSGVAEGRGEFELYGQQVCIVADDVDDGADDCREGHDFEFSDHG